MTSNLDFTEVSQSSNLPSPNSTGHPAPVSSRISVDIGFKLKGATNYTLWRYRIKLLLGSLDWWNHQADMPMEGMHVHNAIVHNVDNVNLEQLVDEPTAVGAWKFLHDRYRSTTTATRVQTLQEVMDFRFSAVNDTEFAALKEIGRKFESAYGANLSAKELIMMMGLARLPHRLDAVRVSLQSRPSLTLDIVEKEVLNESALSKSSSALAVNGNSFKCPHNRKKDSCWTCTPSSKPKNKKGNKGKQNPKSSKSSNSTGESANANRQALLMIAQNTAPSKGTSEWVIDSGASEHFVSDPGLLTRISNTSASSLTVASGETVSVQSCGEIDVSYENAEFTLKDVVASSDIAYNLISVAKLTEKGLVVKFNKSACHILKDGKLIMEAKRKENLYSISLSH